MKSVFRKIDKNFSNVITTILLVTGTWMIADNISTVIHTYIVHGTTLLILTGVAMVIIAEERLRKDRRR